MKEFFIILFFGKTVLLTPTPIDIEDMVTIKPDKTISAITRGASLQIDVSETIRRDPNERVDEFRDRVKNLYPPGSIKAELVDKSGGVFYIEYSGYMQSNKDSTVLLVNANDNTPTDKEFVKLTLSTKVVLKNVNLVWKNYKF